LLVSGFAACADHSTPAPGPDAPGDQTVSIDPAPSPLRRLLARQYVNSIDYLLGENAALAADPPNDSQLNGFASIAAAQLSYHDITVAQLEQSARAVATAAMGNTARIAELLGCEPTGASDEACARSFVERFGRLAFRRPLIDAERDNYLAVATKGANLNGDFYAGIELVIAAMLQSPHFLYQVEIGVPDTRPTPPKKAERKRLTALELATRMSFFLQDRTPSAELLDAAEAGELDSTAGVRTWAQRLLAQAPARQASEAFFQEYLRLDELDEHYKDPNRFPDYSQQLAQSMKRETLKLVDDVLWERGDPLHALLTIDYTFVDKRLAEFYGVAPPLDGVEWTRTALPVEQQRAGILSHASVLTAQSHSTSTSPTHRGLFVLEAFLCRTMPPPPEDVVTELPPTSTAPTMRERLAVHLENDVCRACHYESDQIGLTLENYDAMGVFRTKENGTVIDAKVKINSVGEFDGVRELGKLLASDSEVSFCMLRQVLRHATGHIELNREFNALRLIEKRWIAAQYSYPALLLELVTSELFRTMGVETNETASDETASDETASDERAPREAQP